MPGFSRQERLGINLAQNASIPILPTAPSSVEGTDGDRRLVMSGSGKGPRMYIKSEGVWWYNEFLPTSSHPVESEKQFNRLQVRDRLTMDSGNFSIGGAYHRFVADVPIRAASPTDNTVITQIPGLKFPNKSCIVLSAVLVKEVSNALTITATLQVSETAGTASGSAISSGTELIGSSGTTKADSGGSDIISRPQNTSTHVLSSSGSNVQVGLADANLNEVFINQTPYFHDSANDFYAYLCNAAFSGGLDTPTDAIDNSTDPVTFGVSYTQRFNVGEIILIDSEQLLITTISATSGAGDVTASRAQNSTTIAAHTTSDSIYTLTPSSGMVTVMFDYIGSF